MRCQGGIHWAVLKTNQHVRAPCLPDAVGQWVWKTAYNRARRRGAGREEAEDCAGDTVLSICCLARSGGLRPHHLARAWLFRCVDNWIRYASRGEYRRSIREARYAEWAARLSALQGSGATPHRALIQKEFRLRLAALLDDLPEPVLRRIEELIPSSDGPDPDPPSVRSRGAKREARRLVRRSLRKFMAESGFSLAEACEHLGLLDQD